MNLSLILNLYRKFINIFYINTGGNKVFILIIQMIIFSNMYEKMCLMPQKEKEITITNFSTSI